MSNLENSNQGKKECTKSKTDLIKSCAETAAANKKWEM